MKISELFPDIVMRDNEITEVRYRNGYDRDGSTKSPTAVIRMGTNANI